MVQYIVYKIGVSVAQFLPIKLAYALAKAIAALQYAFSSRDRKAVLSNLTVITGIEDRNVLAPLAKEVFVNFAKYLVDFFRFPLINQSYIDRLIKIEGKENVAGASKRNKGIIAVTAHIGNWELAGAVTAFLGYPVNAVALSHKDRRVNEFFVKQRESKGVKVIPLGAALRRCFEALKKNEVVGLVGDRDFTQAGVWVEFLGRPVRMPKGPAMFHLKTQAPLVPTFAIRQKDDSFKMIFDEPIEYAATGSGEEDLKIVTSKVAVVIEKFIRQYPQQWFMFREFWSEDANRA